jgi:hypothetical protein
MYLITNITRWDSQRDSCRRVAPLDGGLREFLLNPNRISEMKSLDGGVHSCFLFSDNHTDSREKPCYIECNSTVQEVIDAQDQPFASEVITLPIHRKNKINLPTIDTAISVYDLSYAEAYNPDLTKSLVVYYNEEFKRTEAICDLTLAEIVDLIGSITWDSGVHRFDEILVKFDSE